MTEQNNIKKEIIMGLDVSTACIGVAITMTDYINEPEILEITHIAPKISNKIKGIESLFLKKNIFENEFLLKYKNLGISRVIIEEPLLSSNNVNTVSTLLRFNGMISESIYRVLGVVPDYISSYDARKYSFPELMAIRKYNKKGEVMPLKTINNSIVNKHPVLFGSYPFDIDKKQVMMNLVCDKYPNINWVLNKKGDFKKENFDACDALVCVLAYNNITKYNGKEEPDILSYDIIKENDKTIINYTLSIWNKIYKKTIILNNIF